eukprot:CAMPEP_0185026796 /NCGR_PEP_ID=MMETSP1103-20130426/11243_1 /TAXON_ID=36769 /ORGANISM="Paraphysomonas bandaiensis, Strain Caron Lab Isolate" /LENGTH=348 /DNA_ID=CAMNT_0027560499 /DNA_START=365 /DNA_END=1408 /DNA_ORIENTATION=+
MCSLSDVTVPPSIQSSILEKWKQVWDEDKQFLVEKSPQNMLKLPFFRGLYSKAKRVKYVIVIKNPLTLNIALHKRSSWSIVLSRCTSVRKELLRSHRLSGIFTPSASLNTLSTLLYGVPRSVRPVNSSCDGLEKDTALGWINSMTVLAQWLKADREFTISNVRIVRYEDFVGTSNRLCRLLTSFLFSEDTPQQREVLIRSGSPQRPDIPPSGDHWTVRNIITHCDRMFPFKNRKNLQRGEKSHRRLRTPHIFVDGNTSIADRNERRSLRLHLNSKGERIDRWTFTPEIAAASCLHRVKKFGDVYSRCMDTTGRNAVDGMDQLLRPFGYGMKAGSYYMYSKRKTVFDDW